MAKVITLTGLKQVRGFNEESIPRKIVKWGLLGAMGAGAGYFLLKQKVGGQAAALIGGVISVGAVALFRPGGLLRQG